MSKGSLVMSSLLSDFADCFVHAFSDVVFFVFESVVVLVIVDPLFSCRRLSLDVVVAVAAAEGDDDDNPFFLLLTFLFLFLRDFCCWRCACFIPSSPSSWISSLASSKNSSPGSAYPKAFRTVSEIRSVSPRGFFVRDDFSTSNSRNCSSSPWSSASSSTNPLSESSKTSSFTRSSSSSSSIPCALSTSSCALLSISASEIRPPGVEGVIKEDAICWRSCSCCCLFSIAS